MDTKRIRMITDVAMTVILPPLMAYSLIGETLHEVLGTVMFALFIVHHIMNRRWYGSLRKGKQRARRSFQMILDLLLLVFMFVQPISGILMSKHLYTFLPVLPVAAQARSVHLILAYWSYVLICVHAGTHLTAPVRKIAQKNRKACAALCAAAGAVSVYGIGAFISRGFPGYMSGSAAFAFFDFSEPRVFFFLDYLAVMVLCMAAGCLIMFALGRFDAPKDIDADITKEISDSDER